MRPVFDFNGMVGQKRVCRYLSHLADGARARGAVAPSVLLVGPAGHGKSSAASAYARKIDTRVREFKKGRNLKNATLVGELRAVEHGDVVFIDEVHALPQDAVETLYFAVEEQRLPVPGGREDGAPQTESIAEFTLVAATNRPGQVDGALRSRLEAVALDLYDLREIAEIVRRCAEAEGIGITAQAAGALADVAQGSPRLARKLLRSAWLTCHDVERLEQQHVRTFLRSRGIDRHGLTPEQRQALLALRAAPRHTLSAGALAIRLGVDPFYIEEDVERWLVCRGLVDVTPRGRVLAPVGVELAEALAREGDDWEQR